MQIDWKAGPFPHAVADGLWLADDLRAAAAEFPAPEDPRWKVYHASEENEKREGDIRCWGPATAAMIERMQDMAEVLEEVTGICGLVGDTHGGGMHMTGEGGWLSMHRDFNVHPGTGLERRLNLLVYLNAEWEKDWGGTLYLGENREIEVLPLANRTAIFECGPASWHGHPDPVKGEHWRKSLACYFYAQPRGHLVPNSTIWLGS